MGRCLDAVLAQACCKHRLCSHELRRLDVHLQQARSCCCSALLFCGLSWLLPVAASRCTQGHERAQVPGCSARAGLAEACGFATTRSGGHICAGNSSGDVRVYDTHTSKQVALVSPIKVTIFAPPQPMPASSLPGSAAGVHGMRTASNCCLPQRLDAGPAMYQVHALRAANCVGEECLKWVGCGGQVTGPVLACALSDDCRHLLAAIGNGYVFRYEYRKPKPSAPAVVEADALDDGKDDAMSEDSTEQ